MQELIEWNDMYRPLNHPNGTEVLKLKLKQMLEKEKEVIIEAHQDGALHTDWDEHTSRIENSQDYYNETFNTK